MRYHIGNNLMIGFTKGLDDEKSRTIGKVEQMTGWMTPEAPAVPQAPFSPVGSNAKGINPNSGDQRPIELHYYGNDPNDAYEMVDILDRQLNDKANKNAKIKGQKGADLWG
jgi:hypothetical protein